MYDEYVLYACSDILPPMIITLTTDIGWVYAGEMKGAILSIDPKANLVDITHTVSPQNVIEGAFIIRSIVSSFPSGTIHIGIVDPGVGAGRNGIIIVCQDGILVGPDNGLLIPAAERLGLKKVYQISNKKFISKNVSNVFHGRDIFAPVAAYLSRGIKPHEMGKELRHYTNIEKGDVTIEPDSIRGQVMYIDPFGNIITNIPSALLTGLKWNEKVSVRIGGRLYTMQYLQSYGYAKAGEFLLTSSSFDLLEIACNMENASEKMAAVTGQPVTIIL